MEFRIITGTATLCEKQLNELNKKYYLTTSGMSVYQENVVILVELTSKR
jgi:hypothetical protein